jgi:hypothetical protein
MRWRLYIFHVSDARPLNGQILSDRRWQLPLMSRGGRMYRVSAAMYREVRVTRLVRLQKSIQYYG